MTGPWQMARRAERLNPSTIREILKLATIHDKAE